MCEVYYAMDGNSASESYSDNLPNTSKASSPLVSLKDRPLFAGVNVSSYSLFFPFLIFLFFVFCHFIFLPFSFHPPSLLLIGYYFLTIS
ncbi:hypothetical protein ASPFODRAFT_295738 [Aspergillus luchuensis CBS 106.47]|uniref:Uncharacterized protein n=1 Tax=Aspergillus luchuensis (strain CBS 106.47) TaxID=1137211 RepID=A0A1M3TB10_ASPLC|nr:hypothetical protein ASPFODRAFT_295738 [Aspergillus luchuensis CBS 106.47]